MLSRKCEADEGNWTTMPSQGKSFRSRNGLSYRPEGISKRKGNTQIVFMFKIKNSICGPEVEALLEQLSLCIFIMHFIPLST